MSKNELVPEQYRGRVATEVMKSATSENLKKAIREKRLELASIKAKKYAVRASRIGNKAIKALGKALPNKMRNKQVMQESRHITIAENQPVYTEDKSRFFKRAWKEEKRQLYFK